VVLLPLFFVHSRIPEAGVLVPVKGGGKYHIAQPPLKIVIQKDRIFSISANSPFNK
jgi:hypothetical protein